MNREPIAGGAHAQPNNHGEIGAEQGEAWAFAQALIHSRRNVSSRRLGTPGPGLTHS